MRFGEIDNFIWFGAGSLMLEGAVRVKRAGHGCAVFSSARHLGEIGEDGRTLAERLTDEEIPWFESDDINAEPRLAPLVTATTLGVSMGPAWIFRREVCELLGDRFVNFMGIDLPRYRGGAHYTWQILVGDRSGACNLQLINEVVDSGAIVKSCEYLHPADVRIPADYFASASAVEREFLHEFLDEVLRGEEFELQPIQEKFAQYFPYLSTDRQGFVDWGWTVDEIERFVNAFDAPYPGASTFLDGERVRMRECRAEYVEGPFHPFMAGLVYRTDPEAAWVACRGGSLVVGSVRSEADQPLSDRVKVGHRFHTPPEVLGEAMAFRAVYGAGGLKEAPPGSPSQLAG